MELSLSVISSAVELYTPAPTDVFQRNTRGEPLHSNASLSWLYYLPDSVEMLRSEFTALDSRSFAHYSIRAAKSRIFKHNRLDAAPDFDFLILNSNRYYFPAVVLDENNTPQVMLWVRVAASDAADLIEAVDGREPFAAFGLVSNQFISGEGAFGLFSLVRLSYSVPMGCLCAVAALNTPSPQRPLSTDELRSALSRPQTLEANNSPCMPQSALEFLKLLNDKETTAARQLLESSSAQWTLNGSAMFNAGKFCTELGRHSLAADFFHKAQLLDHPSALTEEWEAISRVSKSFRETYKDAFEQIERGEKFRALTILRRAAEDNPLIGNAVLSYCLRSAGVPEEGLKAAQTSLKLNRNQADVLNNKWSYETELALDGDAAKTADDHMRRYPLDLNANINAIDSALLLGNHSHAVSLVWRYHILAPRIERSLEQLFKVYEQQEAWRELTAVYERYARFIKAPTVRTLTNHGEALLELGSYEEAFAKFERALAADPSDAAVITAYARGLARADREDQAEALLRTVLSDPRRSDLGEHRVFIVTTLAEVLRRTGRAEQSIELFGKEIATDLIELSEKVGPLPAIEYIEALSEAGDIEAARTAASRLAELWPEDPYVRDTANAVGAV